MNLKDKEYMITKMILENPEATIKDYLSVMAEYEQMQASNDYWTANVKKLQLKEAI